MGAWTNEGLFWLTTKKVYTVTNIMNANAKYMSHEEYANAKWNIR